MRSIRALLFGLVALLAACAPAGGSPSATPREASPNDATTPPTAVVPTPTAAPTAVVPTPPPGLSGRLLFSRFTEARHQFTGMFASEANGSGEAAVPLPWEEGGGRWSTSGGEIAVPTMLEDGRVGTAILDPNGVVLRVLAIAEDGLNLACTTWSPDDERLACEGWDDVDATRRGIYTVRSSDGSDIQRITTPPAGMGDLNGDWSSDGLIVFKRYPGDEAPGKLFVIDGAGGEPRALTLDDREDPGRFSPDGSTVATSAGGVIQVIDLTGAKVSTIQEQGSYLFGPAWSPDGAWLVFSSTVNGQFRADLYVARPDGTDLSQVTRTSANEIAVDWGP